jgi:hypothetical protein
MTPTLTEELHRALARQPGDSLQVEDSVTHARYVLVRLDVYEQLQQAMNLDTTEPNPRDFYPAFAKAVKDDLDAPGMERYDHEATTERQS